MLTAGIGTRPTRIGGAVSLSADEGSTDAPGDCRLLRGRRRRFVGWPVLDTSRVRRPPATRSGAPPLGCIRSLFRRARGRRSCRPHSAASRRPDGRCSGGAAFRAGARLVVRQEAKPDWLPKRFHPQRSDRFCANRLSVAICRRVVTLWSAGVPHIAAPAGTSAITPACAPIRAPRPMRRWPATPTCPPS